MKRPASAEEQAIHINEKMRSHFGDPPPVSMKRLASGCTPAHELEQHAAEGREENDVLEGEERQAPRVRCQGRRMNP